MQELYVYLPDGAGDCRAPNSVDLGKACTVPGGDDGCGRNFNGKTCNSDTVNVCNLMTGGANIVCNSAGVYKYSKTPDNGLCLITPIAQSGAPVRLGPRTL